MFASHVKIHKFTKNVKLVMENDQNGFDAAKIKLLALHIITKTWKIKFPNFVKNPLHTPLTLKGTE